MQPPPFRTNFFDTKIKNRLFLRFLQVFSKTFFHFVYSVYSLLTGVAGNPISAFFLIRFLCEMVKYFYDFSSRRQV
jgi:hypothetical protein